MDQLTDTLPNEADAAALADYLGGLEPRVREAEVERLAGQPVIDGRDGWGQVMCALDHLFERGKLNDREHGRLVELCKTADDLANEQEWGAVTLEEAEKVTEALVRGEEPPELPERDPLEELDRINRARWHLQILRRRYRPRPLRGPVRRLRPRARLARRRPQGRRPTRCRSPSARSGSPRPLRSWRRRLPGLRGVVP